MIIKKPIQEGNFTIVPNAILTCSMLSWKAKGILIYLLSKPANWKARNADIKKQSTDGIDSIQSGMRELRKHGFAKIVNTQENGKIISREYVIYEEPILNENLKTEKAHHGKSTKRKEAPNSNIELE